VAVDGHKVQTLDELLGHVKSKKPGVISNPRAMPIRPTS
jgi:hypothetical protein